MTGLPINPNGITAFCRRWGVAELWLFGSAARGDAHAQSDVDILVCLSPASTTSTWDWPAMTDEFEGPMAATEQLRACPYSMALMAELGGTWGRSRLMGLAPGASVPRHVDVH